MYLFYSIYGEYEDNEEMEEEFEAIEINDILEQGQNDIDLPYRLPQHHRCASHTLNLIATKDSEKALSDLIYKKQIRTTFSKMQSLWNKQERTSVIADEIHDSLNIYIVVPNTTRWNSTYRAVKCLHDTILSSQNQRYNKFVIKQTFHAFTKTILYLCLTIVK